MTSPAKKLIALAALCAASLSAGDRRLLNLVTPEANFVLGIDVGGVSSSALAQTLMSQLRQSGEWGQALEAMGSNPFQYLDEILIAARIDEQGGGSGESEEALLLARGDFAGAVREMLCQKGCKSDVYQGMELLTPASAQEEGAPPNRFVALDGNYAAMGPDPLVRGLIDRWTGGAAGAPSQALLSWVQRMSGYQIWAAAQGPFDSPDGGEEGAAAMASQAASKLDSFGLGVRLGGDVEMAVELQSRSEKDATELHDMANGLLGLLKAGQQKEQDPGARKFLESLRIRKEGRVLSASLSIPEQELLAQIQKQIAQRAEASRQGGSATPRPRRRPRREGGIRIHGLEDEPVEVPTTPK